MRDSEFHKGDQVEVRDARSEWYGETGIVTKAIGSDIMVQLHGNSLVFDPSELQLVHSPEKSSKWWLHRR